jgi:hypothetical protein
MFFEIFLALLEEGTASAGESSASHLLPSVLMLSSITERCASTVVSIPSSSTC